MANWTLLSPKSVDEAIHMLATHEDSRCIAGGQTLVAMMNSGLVEDGVLVNLGDLPDLRGVRQEEGGAVVIGAMTTHSEVARARELVAGHLVVRQAANLIAHPSVRNMGTMGGAVCHGDPSADYPAALVAAGAAFELQSTEGIRHVHAEDFFEDFLTTVRTPTELLTRITLPAWSAHAKGGYLKYSRAHGDFATVSIACVLEMAQGQCSRIRIALGACGPTPVRVEQAEDILIGTQLTDECIDQAAELLTAAADPVDDMRGSGAYRSMLIRPLLRRAIRNIIDHKGAEQ